MGVGSAERVLGIEVHSDREALSNLIDALKLAEASVRQLAYYREQGTWFIVEQQLGAVRETVTKIATKTLLMA